jgi:hypothetical protein
MKQKLTTKRKFKNKKKEQLLHVASLEDIFDF